MYSEAKLYYITCTVMQDVLHSIVSEAMLYYNYTRMYSDAMLYYTKCTVMLGSTTPYKQ